MLLLLLRLLLLRDAYYLTLISGLHRVWLINFSSLPLIFGNLISIRSVRRMRRAIIFRDNMIDMFAKSDRFVAISVAASTTSTATTFTGGTMGYAIRFLLSFAVKSLKKTIASTCWLIDRGSACTGTLDTLIDLMGDDSVNQTGGCESRLVRLIGRLTLSRRRRRRRLLLLLLLLLRLLQSGGL